MCAMPCVSRRRISRWHLILLVELVLLSLVCDQGEALRQDITPDNMGWKNKGLDTN